MRIQHILGSAVALGAVTALLLPSRTQAYTTIGGSLSLGQRDFRIFDNFTDAQAHNNNTADASFPGYQGVAMSMWKSIVEWGSRVHGNGNGDPTQIGGLGSGGANFDATWQGNAAGVGGTNDNISSELTGSSGGVLAYTETPISDGWRIRYYSDWTWEDGPGTGFSGNSIDTQGVSCHEYGHALGLGHTTVTGSTMYASISGNGSPQRSIEADDIAGVRFIYGVASAAKPFITGITTQTGQVTINGGNFASTGNEVWFTQLGIGGDGTPVKATGVNSTGGGSITIAVPAGAGPGDLLVKMPGSANSNLSNAWPFTPDTGPVCPPPYNTCFTSPNSVDPIGSVMYYGGTQSIANNNFELIASACPPSTMGMFYYGAAETYAAFGNGYRCVASPVFRLPRITVTVFGDGYFALDLNAMPPGGQIYAGDTKYFQFWYRNTAAGGAGFNLSDALAVPFCP